MRGRVALLAALVLVGVARAEDQPVSGARLLLRAGAHGHRRATVVLEDASISPPLAAPTRASFVFSGGAGVGQCHFEVELGAEGWRASTGEGPQKGWVYRGGRGAGIEWLWIRAGRISIRSRNGWGCDLGAAQGDPVSLEVRLDERRYCAAFTGAAVNAPRRYMTIRSVVPSACPKSDVTVATLNILHGATGLGCIQTANCRLSERIDLFFDWVRARGCPDVITLQEVSDPVAALIQPRLVSECPFPYELAYQRVTGVDDAMILSRYPIAGGEMRPLLRNFRRVVLARIDHPIGPLGVFTTHLAASGDGATTPCGASCPAACVAAGASTLRECQAVQVAEFVAEKQQGLQTPALLTGDFNEEPDSLAYSQFTTRGWRDVYLAAGNPECDAASGIGCTSGRADQVLEQLESEASNENERIDFIFLVPPAPTSVCLGDLDTAADADGDGTGTRHFAAEPNPFADTCGPAPQSICWPSDHVGVEADVECR